MMCCKNEDGYYENFIGNVEFHMDEPWYSVRDLLRVLKRINRLDLSHPENRYKALCWLNGMDCTVPYGPTCRFPCGEFFVTEARGCWGQVLDHLKKMLAGNCLIKFEVGRSYPPRCGKKYQKSCGNEVADCGGNTKCCAGIEDACGPKPEDFSVQGDADCCALQCVPENECPITSELCDECLGPEPRSCCPDWCGTCKVKKIPLAAYKCYLKGFQDIIDKMIKGLEKKDCVFSRKSFEKYYRVMWKKYKGKCDLLEDSDSDDSLCEECCLREQQEKGSCCPREYDSYNNQQQDYYYRDNY